ncbi:MAG: hypothetical protein CSA35_06405 [Dethiosulfovibrio peptidovorans]|nr:MAG: hypothetical protein CSA35_06405 [Dethiosulfovibrio peptidovorans]
MIRRALVTGGAGFIGSHLCDRLISDGWSVTVLDNLSSSDGTNLEHLKGSNLAIHHGDIRDLDLIVRLLHQADILFHLAAMISVPQSLQEPRLCYDVNVRAFADILETLRDRPIPVLYTTSAAVYGPGGKGPQREDSSLAPQSPYGASKAMDEILAAASTAAWGIPTLGFRLFNVYGPRQNPEGPYASVIPRFVTAFLRRRPVTIYGDGEQTRDFVYVGDAARVMVLAESKTEILAGSVINVGCGRSTSVTRVREILTELVPSSTLPVYQDERPGDIRHSIADVDRLSRICDLDTFYPLKDGIVKTLDWYRSHEEKDR